MNKSPINQGFGAVSGHLLSPSCEHYILRRRDTQKRPQSDMKSKGMTNGQSRIVFPREVLLIEIERRCPDAHCNAKIRIGLTKEETRVYQGFECERCKTRYEDALSERDIPEWWEELRITGLDALRAAPASTEQADETGEVVSRLSEAWRRTEESLEKGPIAREDES